MTVAAGVSVPGYAILAEVGRGGMGVVYKARQLRLGRLVALKVLAGGAFAGPVERARFRLEAEAVARLHHPNVVQVYDVGETAGVAYIAFEFVDGPTVRRWQGGKPLDPRLAARIAADVARAAHHAHERGIVHRDLKPANILLSADRGPRNAEREDEEGERPWSTDFDPASRAPPPALVPKIMDFGLAKPLEGATGLTATGVACGTPNYMAPEQVRGGPGADRPGVDVWGVGAVLFELLTGRPPFTGPDATAVMQDIVLGEPPPVRSLAPGVPRDLVVVLGKCLEKDPARRYLTAGEAADDLDRFLDGRPILARPPDPVRRAGRWIRRNPIASAVGVALLLGLAILSEVAVAFRKSADREHAALQRERAARVQEGLLREQAERATRAAEAAQRNEAGMRGEAERARARAEENLETVHKAVRHVLDTVSAHSEADNTALVPVYRDLLAGLEPVVDRIVNQRSGRSDLRAEHARILRGVGLLEATSGRPADARVHLLSAAARFRDLARQRPDDPRCQLELARTLAAAGAVSSELKAPDTGPLLREAHETLERYLADRPDDPAGLEAMIRVRLSMSGAADRYTDEHDRAVLGLVGRMERLAGPTPYTGKTRAHALNNIAGDLTNRGKTDEAEAYWVEVLGIREGLTRALPGDAEMRYELAKCLTNYANQLAKTGRPAESRRGRERAAVLFDTLRDDARFRTAYVPVIVDNDMLLAAAYIRERQPAKAIDRLDRAIALNGARLERDPRAERARAIQADAHTWRAEQADAAGRHTAAVRDYRAAIGFSTKPSHREYCTARLALALVQSGDRPAAAEVIRKMNPARVSHPVPCIELARAWLAVGKSAAGDPALTPADRGKAVAEAEGNARTAVLAAREKGMFADPAEVRWFHAQPDFEPIRDVLPGERQ